MLVIKTDCCCSDSVKYSQKLKFLICCLSFLQDPAYDVIYRTHKPFWSHNCNNWLVHLLILRSKSLPLTFMVIFLSCLVFLQQPGGRHHPTKKKKKERAPAAGRCVGTSVYMQTSPFTQFNHTATPAVVSDGGDLTAVTEHRLARRDIPPLYSSAWLSRSSLCCCPEFSGTAWESMTRQMFVISHGEACDRDRNQITEHRKGL